MQENPAGLVDLSQESYCTTLCNALAYAHVRCKMYCVLQLPVTHAIHGHRYAVRGTVSTRNGRSASTDVRRAVGTSTDRYSHMHSLAGTCSCSQLAQGLGLG